MRSTTSFKPRVPRAIDKLSMRLLASTPNLGGHSPESMKVTDEVARSNAEPSGGGSSERHR